MPKKDKDVVADAPNEKISRTSLSNRTRGQLVFDLPHEEYCQSSECSCSVISRQIQEYDFRTQEHVAKVIDQRICTSIGWLAGEMLVCDSRVLGVKAIAAAIQRGDLVSV